MADDETIVLIEHDPADETPKTETPARDAAGKFVKADAEPVDELVQQFKDQAESNRQRAEAAERTVQSERQAREAAERREQSARTEVADSQLDTVTTGLAAAQTEADAASAEYQSAMEAGDFSRAAKAQRSIARAEAKIGRLDEAKADLETRKAKPADESRREQTTETRQAADPVEAYIANRTEPTAKWLREHRDWVTDDKKNRKLTAAHWAAVDDHGLKPDTAEYFEFVETQIGLKSPAKTNGASNGATKPAARRASVPVAPVQASGGGTNGGGTEVRLNAREATAAGDGTHIWNYDDPSPQKKFKKGDPIGVQEFARRKHEMTKQGLYDKSYVES